MAARGTWIVFGAGAALVVAVGVAMSTVVFVAGGASATDLPEEPAPAVIAVTEPVEAAPVPETGGTAEVDVEEDVETEAIGDDDLLAPAHRPRRKKGVEDEGPTDDDLMAEELDALLEDFDPDEAGEITLPPEEIPEDELSRKERRQRKKGN